MPSRKVENSKDRGCLMSRIAHSRCACLRRGRRHRKARQEYWPKTRVQRCMFHVFGQIRRCTTARPRLQAGAELYSLAKGLLHINDLGEAASWLAAFSSWCTCWEEFLREKTVVDGKSHYKHKRLRKARRALEELCREEHCLRIWMRGLSKKEGFPPHPTRLSPTTHAFAQC